MKKPFLVLIILCLSVMLAAQSAFFSPGDHYQVYSEISQSNADAIRTQLESYINIFENLLRYDRNMLDAPLRVRIMASRESYESYTRRFVDEPQDIFLFLQYTDPAKSELVGYYSENDSFEERLVHHAFIQYFKSFIPHPPLWLQKGLAIYIEKTAFSGYDGTAVLNPNMDWTKTLKRYVVDRPEDSKMELYDLLQADVNAANNNIQEFHAQSWGFVHFLLHNENREYNRLIWDILARMDPEADRAANQEIVMKHALNWVDRDRLTEDYRQHSAAIMTFADYIRQGIAVYSTSDYRKAQTLFQKALELNDRHHVPYYYLGLISYHLGDYPQAEFNYHKSLEMGGDRNLTYYALGIVAYSDADIDRAIEYLTTVSENDPDGYGRKAVELLERIEFETNET